MFTTGKIKRVWPLLLCCLFFLSADLGHAFEGKVIKVKDGDTVVIQPIQGGEFMTCRLYGIDAPETAHGKKAAQAFGGEASKELKKMALGKTITVVPTGAKTYNRDVCRLSIDDLDINLEMVKRGYAWAYREYLKGPYASEYIDAESEARKQGLGIWKERNPQPPWEFRKRGHR